MMMIYRTQQEVPLITYGHLNIMNDFRLLLTELAYLTRFYIVSIASGFGDAQAVADRLYQLPLKFKAKAELIFGVPLGEELVTLLSNHFINLQILVDALKSGDQAIVDASVQRLYANADLLAAYFSRINPFWNENQWRSLFYSYDSTVIEEAVAVMTGDYVRSLDIFDRLMLNALAMADYLSAGFINYLTVRS
ncbi:MAG TPA: hypothetical protein VEA58_04120 [Anaerovoracaceae bacterium]|nr:hypothetical protein [Anaerovoracaceae bacterium]